MAISLSVDNTVVQRGGVVNVVVSGLPDGDEATVSLAIVEHLPLTIPTRSTVLDSATVRNDGTNRVRLRVPLDTPSLYSSKRGSLTLEVLAARERLGPDDRESQELTLAPGAATDHDLRTEGVSAPARDGEVQAHPWHHQLAGKLGIWALVCAYGLWRFDGGWKIGLLVGATAVLGLAVYSEWRRSASVPVGLRYRVENNPVKAGQSVIVHLNAPVGTSVDVGHRVVEVTLTGGGNSRPRPVRVVIHEEWAPTSGARVALRVPDDQPSTYRGQWVRIEHEVVLRPSGGKVAGGSAQGDTVLPITVLP